MNFKFLNIRNFLKENAKAFLSFIISAFCLVVAFSLAKRMIYGSYVIYDGDFFAETICFIKQFLRDFFSAENLFDKGKLFYSFNVSLGKNVAAEYAIFSVFNPLNLIYLFIDDLNLASCILVVIKLSLSAFFFQKFCKIVLGLDDFYSVIFSVIYSMCGYSIMFYFNFQFLEGVFMLPIIEIGIYKLIKNNKLIILSLSYAYLFISSFYSGYVVGFFSFFSFIYFLVLCYKDRKWLFNKILSYGISFLLSLLLSSFILIPAAYNILSNIASDRSLIESLSISVFDIIGNLFFGMCQGKYCEIPYLYSGLISIIVLPIFFADKNNSLKLRISTAVLLCFMLFSCFNKDLYAFWHCFDKPDSCPYRFSFLISFMLIAILAFEWKNIKNCRKIKLIIISSVWILLYIAVHFIQKSNLIEDYQATSFFGFEMNFIFIVFITFLIVILKKQEKSVSYKIIFSFVICAELIFNCQIILSDSQYPVASYKEIFYPMLEETKLKVNELKEKDSGIYRVFHQNKLSDNITSLYDYMSIGMFSTFENIKLRDTLYKLGYTTSARTVCDWGGTDFTKMIFGQKYNLYTSSYYDYQQEDAYFSENKYFLGLGFVVNDDILDFKLEGDNPFEIQNNLMSKMTGQTLEYFYPATDDISVVNTDLVLSSSEDYNYILNLEDGADYGYVSINCADLDDNELYAYISNYDSLIIFKNVPIIDTNDKTNVCCQYTNSTTVPKIFEVGVNEDDASTRSFQITLSSDYDGCSNHFKDIFLYHADDEMLAKAYTYLSKSLLEINKMYNGYIEAEINVAEEGILFTSIPYEDCWKIYLDGNEVESLSLLDDSFLGLNISQGNHTLIFEYKDPYGTFGLVLSLAGLFLLIAIGVYEHRRIVTNE